MKSRNKGNQQEAAGGVTLRGRRSKEEQRRRRGGHVERRWGRVTFCLFTGLAATDKGILGE